MPNGGSSLWVQLDVGRPNNRALVGRGSSVTYKTPPLSYPKYNALLEQGFGSIQIP